LAFAIIATLLLDKRMMKADRQKLNHFLVIPLAVVIIGLVASATHLGNPANALYLFRGVGRSPLSTEVFCAVLFLFFGGIYWLQTFASKPRPLLERVWLVITILSALVFLISMSLAYSTRTILSWYTAFVPVIMISNAFAAGPILAMLTLRLAGCSQDNPAYGRRKGHIGLAMFATSSAAAVLTCILTLFQARSLMQLQTAVLTGADLAVWLFAAAAVFLICAACSGLLTGTVALGAPSSRSVTQTVRLFVGCILSFVGILALRLAFHAIHMTVGL
jgi:anaerobic dimethyl sulfoxide reductase subunit C (anchor subunit)